MKKTIYKTPEILKNVFSDAHEYETQKGKVILSTPCQWTDGWYRIECRRDHRLFDGTEEYSSFEAAEKRIEQLLLES